MISSTCLKKGEQVDQSGYSGPGALGWPKAHGQKGETYNADDM